MSQTFTTEVVRRVYDDEEGACIEVGPDCDSLWLVQISAEGKSKDFYGDLRIAFVPGFARQIARAMLACANEMDAAREGEAKP